MFILARCAAAAPADAAQVEFFETKIRPVLASRCFVCHGAQAPKVQGGLQLDSVASIRKGGNSGPIVEPGQPDRSLLIRAIRYQDKELKMPPGKALAPEIVADFEAWVRSGAAMPAETAGATQNKAASKLWSLESPRDYPVPQVPNKAWSQNPIDGFVFSKLAEKGLAPSPQADRRTLIRRVTFDLTGLPPSADEIDAFLKDKRTDAYERLLDRLLASPRYGERWGRYWLDVARYSDARNVGERFPFAYTYRDWVIRAFNEDMPYDRFLKLQLAADLMPEEHDRRNLAALGYLSLGREFPKSFPETVDDRIDVVARGMLGLTVACARCHDHKYDPIPTKDYYSFYSIFSNVREPRDLPLLNVSAKRTPLDQTWQPRLDRIRQQDSEYRSRRLAEMLAFFKTQEPEYLKAVKESQNMSNTEIEELVRDRQLNLYVLNRYRSHVPNPLDIPVSDFPLIYTEGDGNNTNAYRVRYETMRSLYAYAGAAPRAMAMEEVPSPKIAHVFIRGNQNNPGVETPPHFLSCLSKGEPRRFQSGSGRLDLAAAIANPENPLTARVIVNRVWEHHFGQGIVRSPSDFGLRGDPPTHPELLDYLAVHFMESGWSLKKLHRAILLSEAYRQSSADNPQARKIDPENMLLWRMNRQRLDIEALRDSMLAVAGRLDLQAGGPPFSLIALPTAPRRTVYGFIERGRVAPFLSAFDFASPDTHAPLRYVTTVPQQALFLLNSGFVAEQARYLTSRAAGSDPRERIQQLYRDVFGRAATARELEAGLKFVNSAQLESPAELPPSPWSYGYGDGKTFTPFRYFSGDSWLDSVGAIATLRLNGGQPGEGPANGVIRRWVSPVSGKIAIDGTLKNAQGAIPVGDGVHARIRSSRFGDLATWIVNGSEATTAISGIEVKYGDAIDFIVDGRDDIENDGFTWAPKIRLIGDAAKSWDAAKDFRGPAPRPLNIWERYAQVLLDTNEFAFVD